MKLLTARGDYTEVHQRGWPLAGLNPQNQIVSSAWSTIELAALASGEVRLATLYGIYRSNPWAWACVRLLARGIARLPLKVYELGTDGNRKRIRGDLPGSAGRPSGGQQLDNLLRSPSPRMSRRRVVAMTMTDELVYGNALWTADRGPTGVTALWHAPWKRVDVVRGDEVPIVYFNLRSTGGTASNKQFAPEDCVHFTVDEDPETGLGSSPLGPLSATLRLYEAMMRHLNAFFQNQARLSGHLKVAANTSQANLDTIRETVRQLYTAPENAGRVLVTSGDFQAMSESPGQQSIVDLIKQSREEICAAYHVPPPLVGILERAIKSNVRELREEYVRDVIGPWAEGLESELRAQLIPMSPSWQYLFSEFDMGEQLRPDIVARAAAYKDLRPVYSTNELRRMDNLEDIDSPDAEVPMVPLNERPLGMPASAYGANAQPGDEPEVDQPPNPDEPDSDEGDDEDD